jgi:hypothetical protein
MTWWFADAGWRDVSRPQDAIRVPRVIGSYDLPMIVHCHARAPDLRRVTDVLAGDLHDEDIAGTNDLASRRA